MRIQSIRLFTFLLVLSCSLTKESANSGTQVNKANSNAIAEDTTDLAKSIDSLSEKPVNGTYKFDVAFAEWGGKSMGVKVTIVVKGDSIKIIYEGEGRLTAETGEILDQGLIAKHRSGYWIIAQKPEDVYAEEIGGCSGGPSIVDFKNKRYWIC